MPTVMKTTPGRVYVRRVDQAFGVGEQVDVSDADAAYLVEERGDFEVVDTGEDGDESEADEATDPDVDAEEEEDDTDDTAEADADAGEDRDESDADDSAGFDSEAWLDQNYQVREQAVLDGEVEDHLDDIEVVETSETVIQAVDERREQED